MQSNFRHIFNSKYTTFRRITNINYYTRTRLINNQISTKDHLINTETWQPLNRRFYWTSSDNNLPIMTFYTNNTCSLCDDLIEELKPYSHRVYYINTIKNQSLKTNILILSISSRHWKSLFANIVHFY